MINVHVGAVTPDGCRVSFAGAEFAARAAPGVSAGGPAKLVVRPENVLVDAAELPEGAVSFPATVLSETYQGLILRYRLKIGAAEIVAERQNQIHQPRFAPGACVVAGWDPARCEALAG